MGTETQGNGRDRITSFHRNHSPTSSHRWTCLLVAVQNKEIDGAFQLNIGVHEHLYGRFSQTSPFFSTVDIPFEDVELLKQEYSIDRLNHDVYLSVACVLRSLSYPPTCWSGIPIMAWGLLVYQLYEFVPAHCFADFVKEVTESRRNGDVDLSLQVTGNIFKLALRMAQ